MRLHERRNLEGKNNKEEREEGDWKLETVTLTAIKISKISLSPEIVSPWITCLIVITVFYNICFLVCNGYVTFCWKVRAIVHRQEKGRSEQWKIIQCDVRE
jgi:hypothetical protein